MQPDEQALRDDVAFLRSLAEGGTTATVREGAILVAIGVIFGLVALQQWAIEAGALSVPDWVRAWGWLDGLVVFVAAMALIARRLPNRAPGAASRALTAAWSGVGVSLIVADLALVAASRALALPLLTPWLFPLVLFTLIGAAWSVAFAVRRRRMSALAAAGSFAAAVLCGALAGRPQEWLALSGGLVLLLAVPGGAIVRAARRRG